MKKINDTIEYNLRELRGITLSDKANTRLRADLSAYADLYAMHAAKTRTQSSTTTTFAWLSMRGWYRAGAALIAVLLVTGGTAFASDNVLPGNPLYTVKVNIKEPIEVALATSPRAKADKHAELAEKRLDEATKLAVNNSLDEGTQAYLEQNFGEHVDSSLAAADALEKNGDSEASLDVRSHLEASLVAHADILDLVEDKLADAGDSSDASEQSTHTLAHAVELRREVVSGSRAALESDLADDATQSGTLALVTQAAGSVTPETEASLLPSVVEHVAESDDALAEAKKSLEHSGSSELRRAFRKAHEAGRASEIASTLMKNRAILMAVEKPPATTTPAAVSTTTEPVDQEPIDSTD